MDKRKIAILGSTGSIGTQALEVIADHSDLFAAEVLTAGKNAKLLIEQALQFKPNAVVIGDESQYQYVKDELFAEDIKVYAGAEAINQIVEMDEIDVVLTAMVGYAGLQPTIHAIKAKKNIALANKETLVIAGELITDLCAQHHTHLLPVDSEHSAIFQCLVGEDPKSIEKIILTASGGPFRGKNKEQLAQITKADALKHPNWVMGAKITIDSASLMNKGLEVIEAKWLFGVSDEQIEVVVHPQSIVHSLVQFCDGSMKAQLGLPDMKLPIQYALGFPKRLHNNFPRFDFANYASLTFEKPDLQTFQNLALAFEAMKRKGNAPCVLNAANEIAVAAFLSDKVSFLGMSDIVGECMEKINYIKTPTIDDYIQTDTETRVRALEIIG
jgi:1-deoxy-D-xylulose-5-phosphate reductoisomerase